MAAVNVPIFNGGIAESTMKFGIIPVVAVLGTAFALTLAGPTSNARAQDEAAAKPAAASALRSCAGCHDITAAKKKRISVPLAGLYGSKPAKAGIKAAKWDDKSLNAFLEDPAKFDATSKMKFKVKDAAKRSAIVAALKDLK